MGLRPRLNCPFTQNLAHPRDLTPLLCNNAPSIWKQGTPSMVACCVRPKNADAVHAMPVLFQAGNSDHVGTLSGHPIRGQKRKKPLINQRLFLWLVRLAGFEPTTPWFVAKYSIQLSYSRQDLHCSTTFLCPALKVQVQHPRRRICCMPKPYKHLSLERAGGVPRLVEG